MVKKDLNLFNYNFRIIGLSGKAGSGKDTLADILATNSRFIKMSFAKSLKEMSIKYFGIPRDMAFSSIKEPIVRQVLQGIGQCFREEVDRNFWIDKLEEEILLMKSISEEKRIIITDVRYINEINWIRKKGGKLVKIERQNPIDLGKYAQHSSETEMDKYVNWDYNILNIDNPNLWLGNLKTCAENLLKNLYSVGFLKLSS